MLKTQTLAVFGGLVNRSLVAGQPVCWLPVYWSLVC
jgi:hypothetical protein